MGTVAGMSVRGEETFVNNNLQDCVKAFTSIPESRSDFVKFIKDGFWIDYLYQTKLLNYRSQRGKVHAFEVTFGAQRRVQIAAGLRASGSTSSSRSTKSTGSPELYGSFDELYANVEWRTCFAHDSMQAFLFSVICPLYLQNCQVYDNLLHGDVQQDSSDEPCDLGNQEGEMLRLQEILLGSAAYYDEFELESALASSSWLNTLTSAITDCTFPVIICRVDANTDIDLQHTTRTVMYPPVVINTAAQRRESFLHSLTVSPHPAGDLCELWSLDADQATHTAIKECMRNAQPMQLFAKDSTAVLDITHVFDDAGAHHYVVCVLADGVDRRCLARELRNLSDSTLLISHLIKPPPVVVVGTGEAERLTESKTMALLRAKSTRVGV